VRVVFDTNIFVSALMFPGRQAEKALERVVAGQDHLLISHSIIDEVLTVLARKFKQDAEQLSHDAILLRRIGEIVATEQRLQLLRDEPDNRILECAVAGRADVIVTGDRELLDLKEFEAISIVSLRFYLDMK
jgi:putative PIN family toxin of toxin-antitoxin system